MACLFLAQDDDAIIAALRAGASGIIDDTFGASSAPADLVDQINLVASGQFVLSTPAAIRLARLHAQQSDSEHSASKEGELTQRESEVLGLLAKGCTNRDIAVELSLSEHTVRAHLRGIMQKLHVTNRVQAAALAWQGLLAPRTTMQGRRRYGNSGGAAY